jgi:hypothetical protein
VALARVSGSTVAGPVTRVLGQKKLDALLALYWFREEDDGFADAWLERRGYHPKVAQVSIDRVVDGVLAECGVSTRTGWVTDEGEQVLREYGLI